jgi:hypothetical protein
MGRFAYGASLTAAVACFVVFALAAAQLRQDRVDHFVCEEAGSIPTALAHILLGAPIGFTDSGISQYFLAFHGKSAAQVVDEAVRGDAVPTHQWRVSPEGNGIGPPLSAIVAFRLFGLHARSLLWLFLTLLGLSTLCYLVRFRHERLWVAPVFLTGLTLFLLTMGGGGPLSTDQAPIGGIRSYILVAILPVVHWCFELVADESSSWREAWIRGMLLAIQVAIFGCAILVRYSPSSLILAVIVSALLAARYGLAKRAALLSLLPLAVLLVCLYGVLPRAFPEVAASGRLETVVWHRAFIGFSSNPNWPFPGLHERYKCPLFPKGLWNDGGDTNGQCVWFAAPINQSRSAEEINADVYGADYDRAMRDAFFYVVFHYPFETLATFLYYKPYGMIYQTLRALTPWPEAPWPATALAAVQMLLLIGFLAIVPLSDGRAKPHAGAVIAVAIVLCASIPHMIAWTGPPTGQELTAGAIWGTITVFWIGLRAARRWFARRVSLGAGAASDAGV